MSWQQQQGYQPEGNGANQHYTGDEHGAGAGFDYAGEAPPPPPEEPERGAGYVPDGYNPVPPENDIEDPFGVPPPPESLLTNLVFDEPDSPANIVRDPQTQNLKAGSFAKIIERLTHPTVHGTSHCDHHTLLSIGCVISSAIIVGRGVGRPQGNERLGSAATVRLVGAQPPLAPLRPSTRHLLTSTLFAIQMPTFCMTSSSPIARSLRP